MNFREGTRRLAVFLGILGCVASLFVSYLFFDQLRRDEESYKTYTKFASSKAIQAEQQALRKPSTTPSSDMWNPAPTMRLKYPEMALWSDDEILSAIEDDPAKFRSAFPQYAWLDDGEIKKNISTLRQWTVVSTKSSFFGRDGIKSVEYDKDFNVVSIETMNGQILFPTPPPSQWMILLIAALPILGYFLPWGLVRAIGWVGAGFVSSSP